MNGSYLSRISAWAVAAVLIPAAVLLFVPSAAHSDSYEAGELKLKAVFIFNFVRFTEFPEERERSYIMLCSNTHHEMYPYLLAMDNQQLNSKAALRVRPLNEMPLEKCDVLYVHDKQLRGATASDISDQAHLLTIYEGQQRKGIIQVFPLEDRVRFSVDLEAASRAGLRFRSQLLEIAFTIYGGLDGEPDRK